MPDWSIKIVPAANPTPTAPAAFQPDLIGAAPGAPLKVQDDDILTWNNTTADAHWPWPTDANFNPLADAAVTPVLKLSDPIEPQSSSRPSYNVLMPGIDASGNIPPTGIIYYCCKYHEDERGTIQITAVPPLQT